MLMRPGTKSWSAPTGPREPLRRATILAATRLLRSKPPTNAGSWPWTTCAERGVRRLHPDAYVALAVILSVLGALWYVARH